MHIHCINCMYIYMSCICTCIHTCIYIYINASSRILINMEWVCSMKMDVGDGQGMLGEGGGLSVAG